MASVMAGRPWRWRSLREPQVHFKPHSVAPARDGAARARFAAGLRKLWHRKGFCSRRGSGRPSQERAEARMSTAVMRTALRPNLVGQRPPRRLRLEHFVMGGAIVALIVLVVLPLLFLLVGSLKGEQGMSLDHFGEVLTGRLYVNALKNSLILGAWTGLFSLLIGLVLAFAVSRTDVPCKRFIQATATLSYLLPPFLTAIAFTYLFSPNAGLINVLMRDVLGLPWLTFNIFSMTGLVIVTVMHTFPFVYLLASSALESVDASYEEAAQILGASKLRTALSLVFVVLTVAALCLQRSFLARRSYVTLGGKGSRPQQMQLGVFRWVLLGIAVIIFTISILA